MAKKAAKKGGRRPAKESKADKVEKSEGVQLLLSNLPSDRDATVAYETLLRLIAAARTASGRVGDQKKKMREIGFDVSSFLETMKLERMDPLDLAQKLQEQARLGRLRGLPVQIQLFETKYESAEEQAEAEGVALGKAGKGPDTARWPEGGAGHPEHMKGWQRGQQDLVLGKAGKDGKPKGKGAPAPAEAAAEA